MIKSVILIGTESVGKTTLAKKLSEYFKCTFVPEYARIYLEKKKEIGIIKSESEITIKDVEPIVVGQLNLEFLFLQQDHDLVIFDTCVFMSYIYAKYYFNYSPSWLKNSIKFANNQLVIFLYPLISYVNDEQRGSEEDRLKIHSLIIDEINRMNIKCEVLKDENMEEEAIQIIKSRLITY